jgi:hypothetical protein
MPRLEADFSGISTSFEAIPDDTYRVKIGEIEEKTTKESQLPALNFSLEVTEGPFAGRVVFDFVTLKTKQGTRNDIGYGRVKAYAEAILGKDAANGGGIDTDELKGGTCEVVITKESFKRNGSNTEEFSNKVKKVLTPA